MDCHTPPIAIRTPLRLLVPDGRLTTGLNEQFDDAALSSDALERVSLRDDEASEDVLFDFATVVTRGSSPSALRFFSGSTH